MRRTWLEVALLVAVVVALGLGVYARFEPTTYCVFSPHNQKAQWHEVEIDREWGATDIELKEHNGFPSGTRATLHDVIVLSSAQCNVGH